LVFEKNANFFAENCDHNIDPWIVFSFGPIPGASPTILEFSVVVG
jgi:hypothetical protein